MKTGVSCSSVMAELAVVKTSATMKEMLAPVVEPLENGVISPQ